jgi:hypothetical protein
MMRLNVRMAVAAVAVSFCLQGLVAEAGFRHFRVYRSGCSTCSAPVYFAAPMPVCASCQPACSTCAAPGFASSYFQPAMGSGMTGFAPGYGTGYGPSSSYAYGPSFGFDAQPGYDMGAGVSATPQIQGFGGASGLGFGGGSAYGPSTGFNGQAGYGLAGGSPIPQVSAFGGSGFGIGMGSAGSSYYGPMPSQYSVVPPSPAFDLVW